MKEGSKGDGLSETGVSDFRGEGHLGHGLRKGLAHVWSINMDGKVHQIPYN